MTLITPDMKMADVIHGNYLLIPVINRFGIRLGFGEKTVQELCKEHSINPDFFITILNVYSHESYFPQSKMLTFDVVAIIDYLYETHVYYRETLLPQIENQFKSLMKNISKESKERYAIENFFLEYKKELLAHLKREEDFTFPYIVDLHAGKDIEKLKKQYSSKVFEKEHDNVDEKLFDLKNILIKYVHEKYDDNVLNNIIFELFRFERDLKDHTRIENKILIPIVQKMEQEKLSKNA